ncbi:hypothetical protein IEA_05171 [Bacillus toyonensis]|nr:hypothetical protein IEA_05171 [Bacillus toyonensis]
MFLSVDPDPGDEDDPITMNGYTYTDNNPVMTTDPDGHAPWLVINAGFAAYDAYGAYKSGKSRKGVGNAGLKGFVGGPRIKAVRQIGKVVQMKNAKNIRFTQDSVKGTFQSGGSVNKLANQMKRGQVSSRNLPPIKIFKHQGNIHSFDNRRLYAAKKAGVNVRVQWATAKEIQKELRKGKVN